jgi:recombinational DNA repair ATPase RecF
MFILKQVKVDKYKSYTTPQEVQLESDVTTLVGKNESGKTAFLESLAKFNYFTKSRGTPTCRKPRNLLILIIIGCIFRVGVLDFTVK